MSLQREPLQRLQLAEASQPGQCTAGRLSGSMQGPGRASRVLEATGPRSPIQGKTIEGVRFPSKSVLSSPPPPHSPLPLRLSLPTTTRAGSASARSHGAASACFPPSGWAVGKWGREAKCLQAAPLQSQGPPLATKIRAYKAVIDSPCYYTAFIRS